MTPTLTTPQAKDSTVPDKGLLGVVCLALVRFWCRLFGHVQRWSPDDADRHCRRCGHDFYPDEIPLRDLPAEQQEEIMDAAFPCLRVDDEDDKPNDQGDSESPAKKL